MLFDTLKAIRGFVFCFAGWSQISTNLMIFIVSFPKSSQSHPLISQVYCHSLLITDFASLIVVNMQGEMKEFVAMN